VQLLKTQRQKVPALKAAIEDLKAGRLRAGWEKLEHSPTLQAVRKKASLISSGDHSLLETKRITALTVSLKPSRLNPFFPLLPVNMV
jgi:hypothetical protein